MIGFNLGSCEHSLLEGLFSIFLLSSNVSATGGSTSGRERLWIDEMMDGSMNGRNHMMMADSNVMGNGCRI